MKSQPNIRSRHPDLGLTLLASVLLSLAGTVTAAPGPESPYAKWSHGPAPDAAFFPIAVWLQSPSRAAAYREAGINTYVGLWRGPTDAQLADLKAAGMKVICDQNTVGLAHRDDPTIIGWMHGDEPDNAQPLRAGGGYGPPVPPTRIVEDYQRIRAADPTRPVLLNLGQGVAWDGWHGRGVRTNHPEDYPDYVKGGDIVSFDIYPACHSNPAVAGNLWYVAQGVKRLVSWAGDDRVIWNCIECTRISHPTTKATPDQVRAEVWMSLIHGSRGIIYFVHEWEPRFNDAALLADPPMLAEVTRINRQIMELAPVLNSPTLRDRVRATTADPDAPVAVVAKEHGDALYLFAVAMRAAPARATFEVAGLTGEQEVTVLGEERTLILREGRLVDDFGPWQVHLYRVEPGRLLGPLFQPPPEFAGRFSTNRSPLLFHDGTRVESAAEWPRRRAEILREWHDLMGPWPPVIETPVVEVLSSTNREDLVQQRVRVQIAPEQTGEGWLLKPPGHGPFAAVLVVYYEPETSVGLNPKQTLRDFGLQLARRGFVTLSISTPGGDARKPETGTARCQPLSFHAYVAANCWHALANLPEVDDARIGVVGHSYGGKWAMFAAALWDRFACVAVSDPGIVFDETRPNVNYWEPWYLGLDPVRERRTPGTPSEDNPRTGAYRQMVESGHDLHELHALIAPRPFLVSGGAEDPPARWLALNHAVAVNQLLGFTNRVALSSRSGHAPTEESNAQVYAFFEHFLRAGN